MNTSKAVILALTVAIAICLALLYGLGTLPRPLGTSAQPNLCTSQSDTDPPGDKPDSNTGKIFKGLKIRSFNGNRVFAGSSQPTGGRKVQEPSCRKWSVVTTIFEPSMAVKVAAKLEGWCIVIIADTKTPTNYMQKSGLDAVKGAMFLTVDMQRAMINGGDDFVKATPWKHFSRKNIGFLYAIEHGAEIIFDFDDDNELISKNGQALTPLPGDGQVLSNIRALHVGGDKPFFLNPYPLMEATEPDTWPRGFPLDLLKEPHYAEVVTAKTVVNLEDIAVVQSVADHDPDVDAIYRLTRKLPFDFKAAPEATGIIVPPGVYTPYNAQATVHTKKGFWATLLPSTVPGRVSDIWRSYFAERLFRDLKLSIAFIPPTVRQDRNAHNYLGDMNAEEDLYYKTRKLVEFLDAWADDSPALPERMENLWIELFERGYIQRFDVELLQLWLQALVRLGYDFPAFRAEKAP